MCPDFSYVSNYPGLGISTSIINYTVGQWDSWCLHTQRYACEHTRFGDDPWIRLLDTEIRLLTSNSASTETQTRFVLVNSMTT